jgi:hypothetical protein
MAAKLREKRKKTSIVTVPSIFWSCATFPTHPLFHYPLPLICVFSLVVIKKSLSPTLLVFTSSYEYSDLQYSTVQYSTVEYCTEQYSTVQYSTIQYSTCRHLACGYLDWDEVRSTTRVLAKKLNKPGIIM